MSKNTFDDGTAFSRNLGFISPFGQKNLRQSTVGVAGLGGTGGAQVHALARMGIGNFIISDPDTFEVANFNRQANATMNTLGRSKAEVAKEVILSINPEATVKIIEGGIDHANLDDFLIRCDAV